MNIDLLDKYKINKVQFIGEIGYDYYLYIEYKNGYNTKINIGKDHISFLRTNKLDKILIKNSNIHYRKEKIKKILNEKRKI